MKIYFAISVVIFAFVSEAPLHGQNNLDDLLLRKQDIESKIDSHEASIVLLKEALNKVKGEIQKAQSNVQLADEPIIAIVSPKPWLLDENGGKIGDLFKGDMVQLIGYDGKTGKLKVYAERYGKTGYLVPRALGDNSIVERFINMAKLSEEDRLNIALSIPNYIKVTRHPSIYSQSVVLNRKSVKVIGFQNDYFLIESSEGSRGFVSKNAIKDSDDYLDLLKKNLASKLAIHEEAVYIHTLFVDNVNSASGVAFSLDWTFLDKSKTLKYAYVSVMPYNSVGDQQTCEVSGHSLFQGKITGPVSADTNLKQATWENAWYNNTITCVRIEKVSVEYTDGTHYTYINELPKILNQNFQNDCSY